MPRRRVVEVDVLHGHVEVAAHTHVPPRSSLPSVSASGALRGSLGGVISSYRGGLGAERAAEAGVPSLGRVHAVGESLELGACVGRVHIDQAEPARRHTTPRRAAPQRQPPCERAPLLPGHVRRVDEQRRARRRREARAPPSGGDARVALARRRAGPAHLPRGRALVAAALAAALAAEQRDELRLHRGDLALLQLGFL